LPPAPCAPPCWQVLDAIDAGASALIVAPTSSGKTFISSYCISSAVRAEGDEAGLAVFVAPTKALVNQVAAQVGGRGRRRRRRRKRREFRGCAGAKTAKSGGVQLRLGHLVQMGRS
jgi:Lhr-like helicase